MDHRFPSMGVIHGLNALVASAMLIGSAWAYPRLPDRMPVHFDAAGDVTRWVEPSLGGWFLLPVLGIATAGLNYWLAGLLPKRPHLFNFPDKQRFLDLPPNRQAPVIDRMREFLYGLALPLLCLFATLQWMIYRTSLGADPRPYVAATLVAGALMTPLILILWLPRIQREVRRQVREDSGAG
jgi:uncharacterized membrane protein